jgi:hypothetical protein
MKQYQTWGAGIPMGSEALVVDMSAASAFAR